MPWLGLVMLLMVAAGIIGTGLPAAIVLIAVATFGAVAGIASGEVPVELVGALPSRLINLFENDLLQALPLYVTMGLLLDRLPISDALYRTGNALMRGSPSAPLVSGMLLGGLLGPMNGSVGASVLGLSRVISPRLTREGVPASTRDALIAVASTLGVHTSGRPPAADASGPDRSSVYYEIGTVAGALALAALALLRRRLPRAFRAAVNATGGRVIKGLRHLHDGHIGDYVTWLAVGVSIFGGVCAITLR